MALERTSRLEVSDFPDKANSLAAEALTIESRIRQSAGARAGA
ncbi:hypothetical protein GCM10010103_56000 [Streptomyces paradoxus]|uniref:Uncharacterized protein n=1 Tax=Streptomyces paradoxus TaxID=66375 RepID=A0A7W9TEX8_9ACTN|nr:hypothetical protein [Streptomyces paradoxus]MBB6079394.1 hypothetical protein [Streptomyces paradoxus]